MFPSVKKIKIYTQMIKMVLKVKRDLAISKLITDNEENKMKIELLNNKIKNFDELEKKYNEIINANKALSFSEKLSVQLNSNNTSPKNSNTNTHFTYNN